MEHEFWISGIQFGFALQNANVSRIFETLGAKDGRYTNTLDCGSCYRIDNAANNRSYERQDMEPVWQKAALFSIGAILASMALCIITNSPTWLFAAGMLWIMDASINISMEPFRAFVGDMFTSKQRTTGFAMQSFFIGIGAVIGSFLPWVLTNWFNVSEYRCREN